jgi:hypothetical protein
MWRLDASYKSPQIQLEPGFMKVRCLFLPLSQVHALPASDAHLVRRPVCRCFRPSTLAAPTRRICRLWTANTATFSVRPLAALFPAPHAYSHTARPLYVQLILVVRDAVSSMTFR